MTGFEPALLSEEACFHYITSTLGVFLGYLPNDYQYSWMDSNHLKGTNRVQRVYKTPLTTKSHEQMMNY